MKSNLLRFAPWQNHSPNCGLPSGSFSQFFTKLLLLMPFLLAAGGLFSQTTAFITTWKTDNPGTSTSTSITIPTTGTGYLYDADWNNDGVFEQTGITGSVTHNFVTAGTYTVRIRGAFPRIFFNNGGDRQKLLNVNQWGTGAWTSMLSAFWGCSNLNITATDVPNLSGVTSTANMFASCTSLNGPANIGTWNTATVTDMRSMFHTASAFNQPIGTWNTAAATLMSTVFFNATSFNQPIGTWNTAAMTTMAGMFSGATAFNQPLGTWTLNPAVNLTTMLDNCGMDCSNYSATLIGWRNNPATPNSRSLGATGRKFETNAVAARTFLDVTKAWTFTGDAITTAFFADADGDGFGNAAVSINACTQPSGFVANSTDCNDANAAIKPGAIEICNGIDDDCNGTIDPGFTCIAPFITTWRTDNPGTSNSTFITIPTGGTGYNYEVDWNNDGIYEQTGITGSVTHNFVTAGTYTIRLRGNFPRIFFNNAGDRQKLLNISQWGGIAWTSTNSAFFGCSNLNITATDVPNMGGVTNMAQMFRACVSLNGPANIGTWNTAAVTDMGFLFRDASAFNQPIGTWNTANVTFMDAMFQGASTFNQPIGNWNTGKVTNMESMFNSADGFNQPIGNWNTANVTNMQFMFNSADGFNQPIGNWNTAKVTNMESMFNNDDTFNQPIGNWNTANVTNMQLMFNGADDFNQPIGNWNTAKVTNMTSMFQNAFSFNQSIGTWTLNAAVNLTNMLNICGMNCTNYSATLIGWSNNPLTPNTRSLGASGRLFETNAVAARTNLDITKAWTFTGDALVPTVFFADADGDGFGNAAVSTNACSQPSGFVANSTDCNDANANINPNATEIKCNGIDNNCNGSNDELFTFYADVDGDGFGNAAVSQNGCPPLSGFVINNGDCDDSDPSNTPNTTGFCSIMRYDNGDSEPGFAFTGWNFGSTSPGGIFPADASINGIETIAHSTRCWNAISVNVTRFCNFNNLSLCHTGTWRIYSNLDPIGVTFTILETTSATQVITLNFQNINTLFLKLIAPGTTNRHSLVWDNLAYKLPIYPPSFRDADGDGFGDPNNMVQSPTCPSGNGFVSNSRDCNDANAAINPNAIEICNGIDDNCNGNIDEGFTCPDIFITTWKTDNPGTSTSLSIRIPTTGGGYNYDVDWDNNGTFEETGITGSVTHDYPVAGIKTIRIRGSFPRIFFNNLGDRQKLLGISQWGSIAWTSMENAFRGCSNLNITATDVPNLSGVTNMANMFGGCSTLTGPANIGTWNTAAVTDMNNMFGGAFAFNQPIGTWNTAAVTDMSFMFFAAFAFNQPISTWNTAKVTNMNQMFAQATAFNQPIGNWNTTAVTNMLGMFRLTNVFNQPISTWNTAAVTDMSSMFDQASAFNRPIGTWTLNAAVNLANMLNNCGMDCDKYAATLIGWNDNPATPNARSLGAVNRQFNATAIAARTNLTTVKGWTITGDTEGGCIWDPSITTWKTDNPGTSNSTSITIPTMGSGYKYTVDWNNDGIFDQTGITGSVTHDFGAPGIYTIGIRGDFPRIFFNNGGDRLKLLEISHWGDNFWQSMENAFSGCSNLNITATDAPNLSEVTSLANMFNGCSALTGPANIGTWNTSAIKDMSGMFSGATAFNRSLGTWKLDPSVNLTNMLDNCGMDCSNYGATLIGWSNNPTTPNNRSLGATGRKFETNSVAARTNLTVAKSWTISGDALTSAFFADADGDGFGNPDVSQNACSQPSGFVSNSTDCNDANPAIHTGATEICGNGIDENCNGNADDTCPGDICGNSILTNPGFENGAANWTFSGNNVDIVSNQVHSGQKAVRIKGNSGSGHQNKPASAGQTWSASVWAKNNNYNTARKIVGLRFLNRRGAVLATFSQNVLPNTHNYKQFTMTGIAPTGTATVQVYFSKGHGGGMLYVDDWCLSQTMSTAQETEEQDPPSQTLDFFENKKNDCQNVSALKGRNNISPFQG